MQPARSCYPRPVCSMWLHVHLHADKLRIFDPRADPSRHISTSACAAAAAAGSPCCASSCSTSSATLLLAMMAPTMPSTAFSLKTVPRPALNTSKITSRVTLAVALTFPAQAAGKHSSQWCRGGDKVQRAEQHFSGAAAVGALTDRFRQCVIAAVEAATQCDESTTSKTTSVAAVHAYWPGSKVCSRI